MKRHWAKLSELISEHKAAKQANLIGVLNPIIAGWANYDRAVVNTRPAVGSTANCLRSRLPSPFSPAPPHGSALGSPSIWGTTPSQSWEFRDRTGRHQPARAR